MKDFFALNEACNCKYRPTSLCGAAYHVTTCRLDSAATVVDDRLQLSRQTGYDLRMF